jgi:hypothetical protein
MRNSTFTQMNTIVWLVVLTVVTMKTTIFWDVTPCTWKFTNEMYVNFYQIKWLYVPEDSILQYKSNFLRYEERNWVSEGTYEYCSGKPQTVRFNCNC